MLLSSQKGFSLSRFFYEKSKGDQNRHVIYRFSFFSSILTRTTIQQQQQHKIIRSPDADDCHVIVNDKSTEFMLATVVEETSK